MAASYPSCSHLNRLSHPVAALEAPIAELLRVAHKFKVPLVVWSGSPPSSEAPGRMLAHKHICDECEPQIAAFVSALVEEATAALVAAGGAPYRPG